MKEKESCPICAKFKAKSDALDKKSLKEIWSNGDFIGTQKERGEVLDDWLWHAHGWEQCIKTFKESYEVGK